MTNLEPRGSPVPFVKNVLLALVEITIMLLSQKIKKEKKITIMLLRYKNISVHTS